MCTHSVPLSSLQEIFRLCLMIADINDLELKASDIHNAYITVPYQEKVWTILVPEWRNNAVFKQCEWQQFYHDAEE